MCKVDIIGFFFKNEEILAHLSQTLMGVKRLWGRTLNLMGKIVYSIVNGYNLKTDKDNDIGYS